MRFLCALCFLAVTSVSAVETERTGADLIDSAAHVARVRVREVRTGPGFAPSEYMLETLEVFKGSPPSTFVVRILHASRILGNAGRPFPAGAEWLVILGEQTSEGIFPLASMLQGRMDIIHEGGETRLRGGLTGFGPQRIQNLRDFRAALRIRGISPGRVRQ